MPSQESLWGSKEFPLCKALCKLCWIASGSCERTSRPWTPRRVVRLGSKIFYTRVGLLYCPGHICRRIVALNGLQSLQCSREAKNQRFCGIPQFPSEVWEVQFRLGLKVVLEIQSHHQTYSYHIYRTNLTLALHYLFPLLTALLNIRTNCARFQPELGDIASVFQLTMQVLT